VLLIHLFVRVACVPRHLGRVIFVLEADHVFRNDSLLGKCRPAGACAIRPLRGWPRSGPDGRRRTDISPLPEDRMVGPAAP
jgi:hypothetical protein